MQRATYSNRLVVPLALAITASAASAQATREAIGPGQDLRRDAAEIAGRLAEPASASLALQFEPPGTPNNVPPTAPFPKGGASRYQTGMALLNRGLNDAAEKELRAFLEETPSSKDAANARYALGIALSRQSRFEEAGAELSKVASVAEFRYAPDATLLLAQCDVKLGRDADAAAALGVLLDSAKDYARLDEAAAMRGECLQRLGRHDEVIAALADFSGRWATSKAAPRATLVLAMSEASLSKHADAAAHAETVLANTSSPELGSRAAIVAARARESLGDRARARSLYEQARASDDRAIACEALVASARLARVDGDAKAAARALDRFEGVASTKEDPARGDRKAGKGEAAIPPALRGWARYERARLMLDAGDPKGALALLDAVAHLSTSDVGSDATGVARRAAPDDDSLREQAAYWAARCEASLGHFDDAAGRLTALRAALPKGTLAAETLFDLASAHAKAGRAAKAAEAYGDFLSGHAAHAWAGDASLGLAGALVGMGEHAKAAEVCERAIAAAPKATLVHALTLVLAEARFAAKDYAKASEAYVTYLKAASGEPGEWRASVRRSLCALRLDQPGAREMVRRALDAPLPVAARDDAPTMALLVSALSELADSQAASEEWPASAESYSRLASLRGGATEAQDWLRLGISLRRAGRAKDAIAPLGNAIAQKASGAVSGSDATVDAARLELAQALIELNDQKGAAAALQPMVTGAGSPADEAARSARTTALRLMASIESKQGDAGGAAAHLAAAAALGGDTAPELLLDQGLALVNAGELEKAAAAFAEFISRNPAHARREEASARLAMVLSRQGKHEQAAEMFAKTPVASLAPGLRDSAAYAHAMSLAAVGKADDARGLLEKLAAGATDEGVKLAASVEVARQMLEAGRAEEALARLEAMTGGEGSLRARSVYYRASALLKLDRARDAATLLSREAALLAASDIAPGAALLTADALSRSGQLDESLRTLGTLLTGRPAASIKAAALLLQGDVAAAAQRWSESERAYASFLAEFGGSDLWFRARFGLGRALEAQSKHSAAIEAYREVASRHSGATAARSQFQIGECLVALGKHQDAIVELVKVDAAFAEPEWSAAALFEVGRVLVMLKRPDDAARQFDEVVERFPDSQWGAMARNERTKLAPAALPGRRNAAASPTGTSTGTPAANQGDR
ncbi:MAG: tetratricopeptide repeat protein [Phycisphaerales bacterium]